MSYTFLPKSEIVRSLFLAVASPLALAAVTVNQSDLSNPRIWLTGVAIGGIHALGAALLTAVSPPSRGAAAPTIPDAAASPAPVTIPAPTATTVTTTTSAPVTPPPPSETAPSV